MGGLKSISGINILKVGAFGISRAFHLHQVQSYFKKANAVSNAVFLVAIGSYGAD